MGLRLAALRATRAPLLTFYLLNYNGSWEVFFQVVCLVWGFRLFCRLHVSLCMESQNCLMILIFIILGGYVIILGGYVIILGAYVFIFGAYSIIFGAYVFIFGAYSIIFGAYVFIFGAYSIIFGA